ncbi:serine hydrolase [Paenibacillus sp. PK3_47]|uniref:serine hydrolase domain-containing protein n=1 Tax=Paenibacillus sp. PK3_47 TaxID=2072642 RepID=UPI00201DC6F0|nr:serine hydrolase [Paenibacillus sp. PK3_47]UQZ32273.1 serine hydrolase [Paenibacillus sp. PK3_47]
MNLTSLTASLAPLHLRSCLISRQGRLVYEHYRNEHTPDELAKINSCTKSVLSSLICIAMDQGVLPGPDTCITEFFPQLRNDPDPRKSEITLHHLLTLTAGFNWTEFGGQKSFPRMTRTENWIQFVLEQPLSEPPGTRMEYNSGASQLLSAILVQASGIRTARFAEQYLFGPLGIQEYEWEADPRGIHTGGFGLKLRPADLMKLGQLYLQQGEWNGHQLISRELVKASTETAIQVEAPRRGGYAWHWWTDTFQESGDKSPAPVLEYFNARGYGGQFVYVLPALETVVVLTQDKFGKSKPSTDVFREHIAPVLAGQVR